MYITCETCGYDNNPTDAEYCEACGAELKSTSPAIIEQNQPITTPKVIPMTPSGPELAVTTCQACGYDNNPTDAEYCGACGAELKSIAATTIQTNPTITTPKFIPITPSGPGLESTSAIPTPSLSTTISPARLVAKQPNVPQSEFPLNNVAVVGVFDPDSGPVDIDLESFLGGETVSRQHAEIYPEYGHWMVKDLGSLNGIFIKPSGQTRFGARITTPMNLNPGDEIAFGKVQFVFRLGS
ncbi:MAG: zinc ribbon domain-containing protein [Trichodesmium sp. St16_bin4-tuft]|nr:zinc ribbon domain-containing protein [Trichodesmium sp. MAG_R01]MDE5094672.1 zinc ribbon domain-containing protein [Trichodesmium sp. St11_bin5]MDE5100491.1 zinc ribbon domain-containing protein [Trichodesmium sp. St16_bin4-tuft]MDT9342241.1 zinc ribbon domain-containing protein [Trichodesmium erythraeum 21-75]